MSVAWHRREAEAGVAEMVMSKTDPQKQLATRKIQRETRARVEASGLVGHVSRESAPTWAKVDRRALSPRRGGRGDQEVFRGQLQHNGTLGFTSHSKEKARERAKAKELEERVAKDKARANCPDLVSIHPGDRHLAACRTGTRTVTRQRWSHCVQRCGI